MAKFFELLPIGLALIAIMMSSIMYTKTRRKYDKVRTLFGMVAAALLIVAQSSWYVAYVIMGDLQDTVFANVIWTLFNCVTMLLIILYAIPRQHTPRDPK
jgi:hypothetical protein